MLLRDSRLEQQQKQNKEQKPKTPLNTKGT